MDRPKILRQLCEDELVPRYKEHIKTVEAERRLTQQKYDEGFQTCVKMIFESHQEELKGIGINNYDELFDAIFPEFARYLSEFSVTFYLKYDPAVFLRWQEQRSLDQATTPNERQELWRCALEAFKERIPQSKEWEGRIRGLAHKLRRLGRIPSSEPNETAYALLWNIVVLDFLEKTGPDKLKIDGTPRRLDDVVNMGHISDSLKGEFGDDGTFGGSKAVVGGQELPEYLNAGTDPDEESRAFPELWNHIVQEYSPQTVQILELWLEEKTQDEIAQTTGINQSTVSRCIRRIREDLKKKSNEF